MNAALLRYRVIAWIVGLFLLVLTVGVVLRYTDWLGYQTSIVSRTVSPIHGFGYLLYLAATLDLALRRRWSLVRTLLIMLAGTVPFMSFLAERAVVADVRGTAPTSA